MQTLPLADGSLNFLDRPQIFRENQIDELIDLLCDEERHGLVFVAGTDREDGPSFESFVHGVGEWTRQVYGLAQVIVLDPDATQALAREFGAGHRAPPWTIRTYLPGVDPASEIDARRHRILGTSSLAQMTDARVRVLLGSVARSHAGKRIDPLEVLRLRRTYARVENQILLDAMGEVTVIEPEVKPKVEPPAAPDTNGSESAVEVESVATEAETYLAQLELVKETLGVDSLDESAIRAIARRAAEPRTDPALVARAAEQMRTQRARIEELEDTLRDLTKSLDEEQLDHAVTGEDLEKRYDEIRWLRKRVQELGDHEAAFTAVPDEWVTDYPASFEELLSRLMECGEAGLIFTGDADEALAVDDLDSLQKCVRTGWDAVLVLIDYCRARIAGDCDQGVDHYILHTPTGYHQIAPAKHAHTETGTTMERYGDERIFPVPAEVDVAGYATMTAHFKLGRIGMKSPRMYYLDDYVGTGKIYIGYIGCHLTNTFTN
jgi:hypothetical protein